MLIAYTLNIHWRLSLFYNGLEFIKHIQKLFPSSTMIVIQNLVSILCTSWFKMLIIAIVAIALKRKIRVMVFVVFFISNVYLNSLSKLLFADPRPFWYTTNILQLEWKCPGQFGNPSGHSRDAAIFYYILIYDILLRRGGLGYWWTAIVFVWVSVPFSRLYLGAHSSNQVILGLLIGLAWLVVYKFSLQKGIYDIFNGLIRRKHLWQITSILAAYFVTIMIPIFAYEFKLRNLTTTERFISNMMVGCPYTKANTAIKVLNGTFATCGIASLIFGLLVGVWSS
jgi:membrane-associated phospholipid phosphatase